MQFTSTKHLFVKMVLSVFLQAVIKRYSHLPSLESEAAVLIITTLFLGKVSLCFKIFDAGL